MKGFIPTQSDAINKPNHAYFWCTNRKSSYQLKNKNYVILYNNFSVVFCHNVKKNESKKINLY